jgi:hypothetical protein
MAKRVNAGSYMTPRWREMDSNPVPLYILTVSDAAIDEAVEITVPRP